ncbi:winged helix-turn-helix domain-containing protein [Vibrio echinoideorum]|uniref:winged helix-turn-helix domain-containing protein n=1 Tax=Vibrio echinoideorum TaxID=2100116 RepID=UPI0035533F4D
MIKERIQYSFDVWLFVPDEDKLIMDNEDVIIDNRLSKLLDFFCQHPKIVFSRDELINEVWNGSILTDQVITQAIFELRKTLKSAERHSMGYIITIPKRGYKLDVEVQEIILIPPSVSTNTVSIGEKTANLDLEDPSPLFSIERTEPTEQTTVEEKESLNSETTTQSALHDDVSTLDSGNTQTSKAKDSSAESFFNDEPATRKEPLNSEQEITHFNHSSSEQSTYTNPSLSPNKMKTKLKRSTYPVRAIVTVGLIVSVVSAVWWISQPSTSSSYTASSSNNGTGSFGNGMTEIFDSESRSSETTDKTSQATNNQVLEDHKAHSSVHYLSLEPHYIYVRIDESLKNDAFKRGIVHKLMSYLTTYRDFRIVVDETLIPNSANVVSFKKKIDGDREYLDITYFNRISNFKHLGRDYLIDASSLHTTMRNMLDDLLDSFNIDIQKSILRQQISELSKQEESLQLTLESLGLTFMTLDRTDTLKKIIAANEIEPDNHFLMSSRYLYELADIFLLKSSQKEKLVKSLNDRFGKKLLLAENNPSSYRVYDALAAYSLTQDNPNAAERYMTLIPRNEYNVMSMIILAKLEESKGNPAAAEEYYYETILESGYPVVLKVAQTLFFNSNISEIESKVEKVK